MKNIRKFVLLSTLTSLLTACGTVMPFKDDKDAITEKTKNIVLMKVTMSNEYRKSFQPNAMNLTLKSLGTNQMVIFDSKGYSQDEQTKAKNYLFRLELDKGEHQLKKIFSNAVFFPIIANYETTLTTKFNLTTQQGIYYLGNLKANIRERKSGEPMAGSFLPIIDQIAGGATGGTFDVTMVDDYEADNQLFKNTFNQLKDKNIENRTLKLNDDNVIEAK